MALCSVVVATYNGKHLGETIESVLAQDYSPIEVLVLDDADDPQCRELVAKFEDDRLRYLPNATSLGVASNHQRGIEEAQGEYISVVNHDDRLAPDALSLLITALQSEPDAAAAFSPPRVMDADGVERPHRTEFAWRQWGMTNIPVGTIERWTDVSPLISFQSIASVVYRRSAVDPIPSAVGGTYDTWMAYRATRRSPVIHVPDAIGYWREHADNLTLKRSWRRTFERVYLNWRVALDPAMPASFRLRAAAQLPRAVAATAADLLFRGGRVITR